MCKTFKKISSMMLIACCFAITSCSNEEVKPVSNPLQDEGSMAATSSMVRTSAYPVTFSGTCAFATYPFLFRVVIEEVGGTPVFANTFVGSKGVLNLQSVSVALDLNTNYKVYVSSSLDAAPMGRYTVTISGTDYVTGEKFSEVVGNRMGMSTNLILKGSQLACKSTLAPARFVLKVTN